MGNRKLPFGYHMESGEITVCEPEANLVRCVFDRYVLGDSYTELTAMLKKQPIPYQPDKLWNKNMVARMLEESRYIGDKEFPVLIHIDTFQKVSEKRTKKKCPIQRTETQKVLNRLCKGIPAASAEPAILVLLNQLITNPQKLRLPAVQQSESVQEIELQRRLNGVMEQQPVDEDAANKLIMQLASARYDAIGSEEYETERLRWYFESKSPMMELDAEILRDTVSAVTAHGKKTIITLKNGQAIEME